MDLPAPAWRVKTRPCPFYQQGRCLFENSCNFLHTVSAKGAAVAPFLPSQSPHTPQKPPLVTIHSPSSVRSPPRSPRLSGLLYALKDVIGEPDEEFNSEEEATYVEEPPLKAGDKPDYTLPIDISHSLPNATFTESAGSIPTPTTPFLDDNDEDETLRLSSRTYALEPETEPQPSIHTRASSPEASAPLSDLLSPVDLTHLHLPSFNQDGTEPFTVDSGNPDAWSSNPRSPASPLKSTFGVLSSPFATMSSRVLSPRLSAFISRSPQSPFTPTPENDDVSSELSLDSPIAYTFPYVEPQPEPSEEYVVLEPGLALVDQIAEQYVVHQEPEDEFEPEAEDNSEDELNIDSDDENDTNAGNSSAASWDHNGDPTAVYVGMPPVTPEEVHDALRRATRTPVHFLAETVEFNDAEAIANSSLEFIPLEDAFTIDAVELDNNDEVNAIPSFDVSALDEFYIRDSHDLPDSTDIHPLTDSSFVREETISTSTEASASDDSHNDNEFHLSAPPADFEPPVNSSFEQEANSISSSLEVSASDTSRNDDVFDLSDSSVGNHPPMDSSLESSSSVDDCEEDSELDETAQLAYLHTPTIPYMENDTLHSLYDQYYGLSEEEETEEDLDSPLEDIVDKEESESPLATDNESPLIESPLVTPLDDSLHDTADIESLASTTPVRSGFLRERVFTPPPTMSMTRGRSGTIIAVDSPNAGVPPPLPFSLPPLRPSPSSAWSPDSAVSDVQEPVASSSKKIPFGFRKSLNRTSASTLTSQRLSKRDSLAIRPPPAPIAHVERADRPKNSSPTSAPASGLRPLRLSTILSAQPSSAPSRKSVFSVNSYRPSRNSHRASISSTSVSSDCSYTRNPLLLSSSGAFVIPEHVRNTRYTTDDIPSPLSSIHLRRLTTFSTYDDSPRSAPLSRPVSWQSNPAADLTDLSDMTQEFSTDRPFSRAFEPSCIYEEDEEEQDETFREDNEDHAIRLSLHSAPIIDRRASVLHPPMYALETTKPTLMFAIASDDVEQVRHVLKTGGASPNEAVGPQSALAFALTNKQLTNKMEIVKTLLAFGADPKTVVLPTRGSDSPYGLRNLEETKTQASPPHVSLMDALDPATRYYVERADAPHTHRTSALIQRSFFRPLTRVRYELIGQDQALEQLFKDLSMHSRQLSVTPIVVLLCGPSGHGKSLLARKFGSLLDVPTHTVDMTTIHSAQDLWKSYSMSPYDPPSTRSLAEFLCDNEGKRCVVVLDEIEKTHGESPLWALLMPWEHGRCTFEAHGRLVDVRNVVWLGTSNIGQDLVFEHHNARPLPDELMSKGEYTELMALLRPRVSERLGASMLSRVTTALPFVPFTTAERRAICYEALHTIAGDIIPTLSTDVVDSMVKGALANYTAAEGARSLYRAVSNQLVDTI